MVWLAVSRRFRHNAVNDLIKRELASADTPAILEPASHSRGDGKKTRRTYNRAVGLKTLPRVGLYL